MSPTHSVERPYGWAVVAASVLCMAVATGSLYVVVVGLKPIAAEFGGSRSIPSLGYSVGLLGMGVGGILMGRWADRKGTLQPLTLAGVMIPLGAYIASTSSNEWILVGTHAVFFGLLGNAAFFVPLMANVTRWFDRRRGLAVAVVAGGQGLGGAIWPQIFRYLIENYGWRETYVFYGIVALVVLLPMSFVLAPAAPDALEEAANDVKNEGDKGLILGLPALQVHFMLCFAAVGCCVAMAMPMVHIIAHATDLGYSSVHAAWVATALLGASVISRIVWGIASNWLGGLKTLLYGSLCQAAVLSCYLFTDNLPGLYAVSIMFGLAYGGIVPAYTLIVRELFPLGQVGERLGYVYLFGTIGMALGGTLGGYIFDLTESYRIAFAVGVLFNLGNLMMVFPLTRRHVRSMSPQSAPA